MSMKRKQFLIIIFSILCVVMTCGAQQVSPVGDLADVPDSAERFMLQQLAEFPQEKIYIQTDKGAYLSGERIWVRTHLQDALTHRPILLSRYVYVELLSPTDNLVKRIKVRPDSTGAYSGHIDLHDDLAEGSYTLSSTNSKRLKATKIRQTVQIERFERFFCIYMAGKKDGKKPNKAICYFPIRTP